VFQLQKIWAHGKGLLRKEERTRNEEMFQMRERRTHCKELQGKANDEEQKSQEGLRQRRRQEGGGFW